MNVKKLLKSNLAKIAIDISMLLIFILNAVHARVDNLHLAGWSSHHCIFGIMLLLLMMLHIAQHWALIKALAKKQVLAKNKITAAMTLIFCIVFLSICFFAISFNVPFLKFHHVTGALFELIVIIHVIHRFKRFLGLFRLSS